MLYMFCFFQEIAFILKDLSNTLGLGDSHLATLYQEHQDRQETDEKLCKWANADELKAYEQNLCNSTGKTVAEMLDNWTNPVFGASEKVILSLLMLNCF